MLGKSKEEIFTASAGTGEMLTVIYQRGRAPGHKRRIAISSIEGDDLQVREYPSGLPRTYLISQTVLVDEHHPAPWMPENAGKPLPVFPEEYFENWAYRIEPHFYAALGVYLRYVIDQAKTQPARDEAITRGMSKKEATKRIQISRSEFVIGVPPVFDFHEGDIFYRTDEGNPAWIQIVKIKIIDSIQFIEVHTSHQSGRDAFLLSESEVSQLLRSGDEPLVEKRIPPSQSDSEALRLMINQPNSRQ